MRTALMLIVAMILIAGCKSSTQKQFEAEQVLIAPAMELDPTEPITLARWWANDSHLLQLNDNAAYTLYEIVEGRAQPIERGRWAKESYALLWLEPYDTPQVQPRRVGLSKIDGKLALHIPTRKPMFERATPPESISR